ncbi:putative dehydrogenase [Sporomusaceae bacterium BoRhaA]|uniref:Gfo/Idh/MocA family protein n=1 Tax=Pelorhabdus rhamnosifermentans TaxID=2772457 RepID=UPI001C063AFB|nr:Gfo/Idh/MocA family oxidoreductase [Pelorhabdus rhamnosifermentans]MBU2699703.1 putative dehydrogenase [Pelorhabdus rhamnosifermentans]
MTNFGVVGTSWITEEFIRCASLTGEFCLQAVYSRKEEKARAFADKYTTVKNFFTDLGAMAKSPLIDAVYIASPNSFHAKQAIIFMLQKKHVLCEKPIASNEKELSMMINIANKNQVLLMEAIKTTFLPNFLGIQESLPKLGKIRKILFNYCQYSSRYDAYKAGKHVNTFDLNFSNGSLMDIGIYCVYPIIYLFGKPKKIIANAVMLDSGIDGTGSITLKYQDFEAIISHSKISNSYIPSEIQGEQGSMIIDKISTPEEIKIMYRDGKTEEITRKQSTDFMYYEAKEFIDLVKQNKRESTINSWQLSLDVMNVLDAVRKIIGLKFLTDEIKPIDEKTGLL